MALIKRSKGRAWDPFAEFDDLQQRMRNMLASWPSSAERESLAIADWAPSVNIAEDNEEYRVEAELPGVKKDDVNVSLEQGVLSISGERRYEEEKKTKKYHRVESSYGSFLRRFTMPEDADEDRIQADFKDGLLTVRIGRTAKPEAKTRTVTIK